MSDLIYIAAPYSHPDKDVIQSRMETLYSVMNGYISKGEHVITPLFMHEVVIRHEMKDDYEYWEPYCLNILKRCDKMCVVKLDGWDRSRGVREEIEFCGQNNIPVEYIECIEVPKRISYNFICPKCGSYKWGTDGRIGEPNCTGHCHGGGCKFSWNRNTEDAKYLDN